MTHNRAAVSHRLRDPPFGRRPSTPIDERPTLFAYSRHASLHVRSAAPLPTATTSVGMISSTGIGRGTTDGASTPISLFLVPFAPTLLLVSFAPRRAKVTCDNRRSFRIGFRPGTDIKQRSRNGSEGPIGDIASSTAPEGTRPAGRPERDLVGVTIGQ